MLGVKTALGQCNDGVLRSYSYRVGVMPNLLKTIQFMLGIRSGEGEVK